MVLTNPLALIVKVPLIVEDKPKLTPPARVTLLNPTVPLTVPVPGNATVPVPLVKVPELANVPVAAMVRVYVPQESVPPELIVRFFTFVGLVNVTTWPFKIVVVLEVSPGDNVADIQGSILSGDDCQVEISPQFPLVLERK